MSKKPVNKESFRKMHQWKSGDGHVHQIVENTWENECGAHGCDLEHYINGFPVMCPEEDMGQDEMAEMVRLARSEKALSREINRITKAYNESLALLAILRKERVAP